VTRALTALFGLVQIGVGIAGGLLTSSVVGAVLGIAAFTTGVVLGGFFLGVFTTRVGQRAALSGLILGAFLGVYITLVVQQGSADVWRDNFTAGAAADAAQDSVNRREPLLPRDNPPSQP
jgi:Na+/proline symporter